MRYEDWFIIDEDENMIIGTFCGTEYEAREWFEQTKEGRDPMNANYWNTWALYKRFAS